MCFHGSLYGNLRLHLKCLSLVWEASHERILTCDNLQMRVRSWWIGAFCAKLKGNQQTPCCVIVLLQELYGIWPLAAPEFLGLFPVLVGITSLIGRASLVGKLKGRMTYYPLMRSFAGFGVKETWESLRVWRCPFSILKIISSRLSCFSIKGTFIALLLIF